MMYASARGRYLAALGVAGALGASGCRGAEPNAASTSAGPSKTAAHTEAWVPAVEEPQVKRPPGMPRCPQGPFCVPQPSDPGPTPAASPHQSCSAHVPLPATIQAGLPGGPPPTTSFDPQRTTAERASDPGACCYQWHILCPGGRVLRGPEGPVTAAPARRDDWLAPDAIQVVAIAPEIRAALGAHWEREAAFEHASVASFARASLGLLAAGAPPDLVAAAHAAAIDEIEHARIGYALASAYGGRPRGPGALPAIAPLGDGSLETLAAETLIDACAGESTAALALREACAAAEDEGVRALLSRIAGDEERHAELAWRTVAWAARAGGEPVARALRGAIAELERELLTGGADDHDLGLDLSAHGVLGPAAQRANRRRAVAEVVIPCARALLA
jgi:hypothetical protein